MAGYRRVNAERRVESTTRLAEASTPGDRVSVAAGYLRGALKHADPAAAERVAARVVAHLIRHGPEVLVLTSAHGGGEVGGSRSS
jgi:hypothetical protein